MQILVRIHAENDLAGGASSWLGRAVWGMLGTVVCLLTTRERMAVAGPVEAVRTVMVPCSRQGPYRDTPRRSGGSKHRPRLEPTDLRKGTTAGCRTGQATARDGT